VSKKIRREIARLVLSEWRAYQFDDTRGEFHRRCNLFADWKMHVRLIAISFLMFRVTAAGKLT
jgi:hypothetical protein